MNISTIKNAMMKRAAGATTFPATVGMAPKTPPGAADTNKLINAAKGARNSVMNYLDNIGLNPAASEARAAKQQADTQAFRDNTYWPQQGQFYKARGGRLQETKLKDPRTGLPLYQWGYPKPPEPTSAELRAAQDARIQAIVDAQKAQAAAMRQAEAAKQQTAPQTAAPYKPYNEMTDDERVAIIDQLFSDTPPQGFTLRDNLTKEDLTELEQLGYDPNKIGFIQRGPDGITAYGYQPRPASQYKRVVAP